MIVDNTFGDHLYCYCNSIPNGWRKRKKRTQFNIISKCSSSRFQLTVSFKVSSRIVRIIAKRTVYFIIEHICELIKSNCLSIFVVFSIFTDLITYGTSYFYAAWFDILSTVNSLCYFLNFFLTQRNHMNANENWNGTGSGNGKISHLWTVLAKSTMKRIIKVYDFDSFWRSFSRIFQVLCVSHYAIFRPNIRNSLFKSLPFLAYFLICALSHIALVILTTSRGLQSEPIEYEQQLKHKKSQLM